MNCFGVVVFFSKKPKSINSFTICTQWRRPLLANERMQIEENSHCVLLVELSACV